MRDSMQFAFAVRLAMRSVVSGAVLLFGLTVLPVSTASAQTSGFNAVAVRELKSCPGGLRRNCVSSLTQLADSVRYVGAFELKEESVGAGVRIGTEEGWALVQRSIAEIPRVKVLESTPRLIRAEVRSRWFGFPDDLELSLSPSSRRIHVRSASRRFPLDFGVNRGRIEDLRAQLQSIGVIE